MAKARAIAVRRKAVGNIKKITHTMQLIATAQFQKSLNKTVATKPYTQKITELVQQVSAAGGDVDHPLLRANDDCKKRAVFLLTSNRGFCGGHNGNVIRKAISVVAEHEKAGDTTDLYVVGKKGTNYFKFLGQDVFRAYPDMPDAPAFGDIEPIASDFMADYEAGKYASVQIVYMRFISASKQTPEAIQLLPIEQEQTSESQAASGGATRAQYDFSPEPAVLLAELLPVTVKIRLFQCVNDAVVSENVARMVAMKSATDAATDMGKILSRQFNRARQSQITLELLDIMGGVEALK